MPAMPTLKRAIAASRSFSGSFGFLRVGAIEFRVMLQFGRLRDACTESLAVARLIVQTPRVQQIAPLSCQRDDGVVAVEADRLNQP